MKYGILIPPCVISMQSEREEITRKLSSETEIAYINSPF